MLRVWSCACVRDILNITYMCVFLSMFGSVCVLGRVCYEVQVCVCACVRVCVCYISECEYVIKLVSVIKCVVCVLGSLSHDACLSVMKRVSVL